MTTSDVSIQETASYEDYYGFEQSPFSLSPDPRFLYRSAAHDLALSQLQQAIRRREGFIILTGDIGTGKTTTCRALLQHLDKGSFVSLILNPFVSADELLREVLLDFGLVSRESVRQGRLTDATTHDLVSALHDFLRSLEPLKARALLIIDEAQHLSISVLEQLRVVSNLETNESKLLQIVLIGQNDLLDTLEAADLRQFSQRISLRATLTPLARAEVASYVAHRLSIARGATELDFEIDALGLKAPAPVSPRRWIRYALWIVLALALGTLVGAAVLAAFP